MTGKISDFFSGLGSQTYTNPLYDKPAAVSQSPVAQQQIPRGTVNPEKLPEAFRFLESNSGTHPDTPRNTRRSYTTVPANGNEQARTIDYDVGFGGEYGLTPLALAQLAKSTINHDADPSTYTQHGKSLTPGMSPEEIQSELLSVEGAGRLSRRYFDSVRTNKEDFSPESLANDYVDYYVGSGMIHDTPENRKRALEYFTSIID